MAQFCPEGVLSGRRIAMLASIESSFKNLFANQLRWISQSGAELIAISSLEYPENLEFFHKTGIKFIPIEIKREISPFADLKTLVKLLRILSREKVDLIHNQTPKPCLLGSLAGRILGIPTINTARPIFREMPGGLKKKFFIFLEKISCRLSHLILVENPLDLELYLELGIEKREKLRIQGNGIDLERFNPKKISSEEIEALRKEIGLPEDAQVVGCVARYVYEKGYKELFEAFSLLKDKYPNLWLLTVGFFLPSERDPIPRELPEKMGISDRVIMLENRSDMERIYALMDIFVLPTHRDCFPRSLIEASAMAKPIIATDIDGCRVVLEDRVSGILVPPKSSSHLARAVEELLNDAELARRLGENARRKARENFDESLVCSRIISAYQRLLGLKS